jgi:hypothetical protein
MWQFIQTYGLWIVFGIFFLLMMRMHFGGMGGMHGGGGGMNMDRSEEPLHDNSPDTQRAIPLDNNQHGTVVRDITPEGKVAATDRSSKTHRSDC